MAMRIVKPSLPDEYLVDNRVYTDPRVFEAERDQIFLRVWNFVCHESEIPRPGDYITTIVGQQPIIVCRNGQGKIRAFYNTCRHRAAQLVLDKSGNARAFTCLYHLWSYDHDGRLLGVPQDEAYKTSFCPGGLDKERMGLVPVRAESMHKLVFVCFDEEASNLAEFLGPIADELRATFESPDARVEMMWSKIPSGELEDATGKFPRWLPCNPIAQAPSRRQRAGPISDSARGTRHTALGA